MCYIKATPYNLVSNSRGEQGGVKDISTSFYIQSSKEKFSKITHQENIQCFPRAD